MSMQQTGHGGLQRPHRTTAVLGLVALVLLQVSMAAHQFEHVADHGFTVCHACSVYNQLDDVPAKSVLPAVILAATGTAVDTDAGTLAAAPLVSNYRSRAPPLS